jgi:hypothetical protein
MAFMTPVIKPGWNLYNCHPPPGKMRQPKRIAPLQHAFPKAGKMLNCIATEISDEKLSLKRSSS